MHAASVHEMDRLLNFESIVIIIVIVCLIIVVTVVVQHEKSPHRTAAVQSTKIGIYIVKSDSAKISLMCIINTYSHT